MPQAAARRVGAAALIVAPALALALFLTARRAGADLASDAVALAEGWKARGERTIRLAPMFLEHGRTRLVRLPDEALGDHGPPCTTVAFLTGRSTDFVVRIEPLLTPKHHAQGGRFERSVVGSVVVSECGPSREALSRLVVELRVARSAVEVVVGIGDAPAPMIADVLPERASGPVASLADTGERPALEPASLRARRAEQRARTYGATSVRYETYSAETDGSGKESVRLEEGCHRVDLFADLLGKHPIDLDAELRDGDGERLLAHDRSDAPDAHLEFCVGAATGGDLVFAGAPGPVHVTMLDAVFPLPKGAPQIWGARARAGVAAALLRRKLPSVDSEPIEQRLGVAGTTSLPMSVDPGSCYLGTVSVIRGEPRSMTLAAKVDTRVTFDAAAPLSDGAAIAFCSNQSDQAGLEIDVRGSAVAWVLELYRVGSRSIDEGR